jgi:hypothetical protein
VNKLPLRQFPIGGSVQADATISFQQIELAPPGSVSDFLYGVPFSLRGDWFYCDAGSEGTARVDFYGQAQGSDPQSFTVAAGFLYRRPFNQIRVYCNYLDRLTGGAQRTYPDPNNPTYMVTIAPPTLRVYYGTGPCPFETPVDSRGNGTLSTQNSGAVNTAAVCSRYFSVAEGMILRSVSWSARKVGVAADASQFMGDLQLTDGTNTTGFGFVNPDSLQVINVVGATTGWAQFKVRDFVVPKGVGRVYANIYDRGTTVTQLFTQQQIDAFAG